MKKNIEALIEQHLNCVHWVIRSFIGVNEGVCGLEYDDLYQEGCIALWQAAESFDEQRGAQFHSYAISVIRNHLLDYCRKIQSRRTIPASSFSPRSTSIENMNRTLTARKIRSLRSRLSMGILPAIHVTKNASRKVNMGRTGKYDIHTTTVITAITANFIIGFLLCK